MDAEIPGVDNKIPGVDNETPGVDNDEDTPGVDDTDEIPGVNNEPVNEEGDANNEEGDANEANNKTERTAGRMNLRNQNRREYNVFNLTEEAENEGVLLFQMNPNTFDTVEAEFDVLDAEYLFLTESLGWKEGLNENEPITTYADMNDVTKLAEYLFS